MNTTATAKPSREANARNVRTSTLAPSSTDNGTYLVVETNTILVTDINPRHTFDQAAQDELTASVKEKGVLEPLLVRPLLLKKGTFKYELVAGERRLRAAKRAQRPTVPVILRDWTDREALEVAVIENEQRSDVPILEKAAGYKKLMEQYEYSAADLAGRIHKTEAEIHAVVKLLDVPDFVNPI